MPTTELPDVVVDQTSEPSKSQNEISILVELHWCILLHWSVPVGCPDDPWHGRGIGGRVVWISDGHKEDCKEEDLAGRSADEATAEGWTKPGRLLPDKNDSDRGTVLIGVL